MRKKITIMIAIVAAMLFSALNITIVSTALPKIVADIGGLEHYSWVFTIYMLMASITAILVGKLSDIYGRRIFILTGIAIFIVGGISSGFSQSITHLIISRGIQGMGGGIIMSSSFATIGDLFSPRERGRWQGLMSGSFGLASLIGPTLGGFIVDQMNWSWVFWIFLPIGVLAFIMIYKLYPKVTQKEKEKTDYLGSFTLSIAIFSLLLGFSWAGNEYTWDSAQVLGMFALFFVSFIIFIFIERKVASPVVPLYLFKNSIVSISNLASFLFGFGMFGIIMYVPFYVQGVLGRTATVSGLTEMVMTVANVIISMLTGFLITKTGKYKIFALLGFGLMTIGMYLNSQLTLNNELQTMLIYLVIIGMGLGLGMPIFTLTVQNAVSHKYLGVATATSQLCRQLGGTIGVSILGTILNTRMASELKKETLPSLPDEMSGLSEELQNPSLLMDSHTLEQIKTSLPTELEPLFTQLVDILRGSLNAGLTNVFFFSACIALLGLIVTLFLKEIPLRESNLPSEKTSTHDNQST